jgi:D-alanyl-D-alanine carboxypeptidase
MAMFRILLFLFLSISLSSGASAAGSWPEQKRQLAAALDAAVKQYDLPGAAIGVWTPRGNWVITKGYADLAAKRPLRREDRFGIRSVTKSFTVTTILQLVASGKLGLDDKVGRYVSGVPNGHLITIRQLANMTSGLIDYSQTDDLFRLFVNDLDRRWTNEELLSFAFKQKPLFTPGSRYDYSNTNTVLLGVIV